MVKVGLIGCGFMGGMHSVCYKALDRLDVAITAVADLREEKRKAVAANFQAAVYNTGMELIEKADVDIIDICLPTYLHTDHALAAMEKGRAVFIEKPVCLTLDEGDRLLAAQKKYDSIVMIGQCIRLWDEYAWLKNTLEHNIYGKLISAVFQRVSPRPGWAWENWLHKPECSGTVVLDLHIHDVDYIRYIMGDPNRVSAIASRDSKGVLQHIFALYEYPGAVIHVEAGWDYPEAFPFSMNFCVKCEQATITFDASGLTVYPNAGGILKPEMETQFKQNTDIGGNVSSLGGYYNELKYFIECIKNDTPPIVAPLDEAVKSVGLCLKEIALAGGAVLI
jgi:predicted dehydrogenase